MNKLLSALTLIVVPLVLSACSAESPIAQTAEAAPPVIATKPSVGQIYGRWATNPAFCSAGLNNRTIVIGESKLESPDRTCTMTTPEPNGEGWLVTLDCTETNGGANATERVRFVPSADKLELNFVDRTERNDERLARCPG